jgi:hypothetical protein
VSDLSFNEKSALGTLIALIVLGSLYASTVVRLWSEDLLGLPAVFGLGVGFTILLVVILIGYHVLIAAFSKPAADDERDRVIAWRAGNIGGVVLGVTVMTIVLNIVIGGIIGRGFAYELAISPAKISIALIAAIWLATVVELALTLRFYRTGP